MPAIEIVSIACTGVPDLPDYPSFILKAEPVPQSHRDLFQDIFDQMEGVIVHLEYPFRDERKAFWFTDEKKAGRDEEDALFFRSDIRESMHDLFERMLEASPLRRITFSSAVPSPARLGVAHGAEMSIGRFFDCHDKGLLRYNHLWFICPDS